MTNITHHLRHDCLIEIGKYLTVEDRIRFQRVNSEWRSSLVDVLRTQQSLLFASDSFEDTQVISEVMSCRCYNSSHDVRPSDIVRIDGDDWQPIANDILARCPGLTSLFWYFDASIDELMTLTTVCNNLEHLYIKQRVKSSDMSSYFTQQLPNLRCLSIIMQDCITDEQLIDNPNIFISNIKISKFFEG